MDDITKEEFVDQMYEYVNTCSLELDKYNDIPDKMYFEDWYDQFIAFMSMQEEK